MAKSKTKNKSKKFTGRVTLDRARSIYIALGFPTAKDWDVTRLQKKIGKLQSKVEGVVLKPKMQKRVDTICKFITDGGTVTVYDPDDKAEAKKREKDVVAAGKREKARKDEKKRKDSKKAKSEERKKAKKEKAEQKAKKAVEAGDKKKAAAKKNVDKFGSREGTIGARLNAVISRKPKTYAELIEEAKIEVPPGTNYYKHFKKLLAEKLIEETDKGYRLVK